MIGRLIVAISLVDSCIREVERYTMIINQSRYLWNWNNKNENWSHKFWNICNVKIQSLISFGTRNLYTTRIKKSIKTQFFFQFLNKLSKLIDWEELCFYTLFFIRVLYKFLVSKLIKDWIFALLIIFISMVSRLID